MRKFLLIIILLISFNGKAQTWCPPGATWYYTAFSPHPLGNGYFKFEYKNDTLVNSIQYKKINKYFIGYNSFWGPGLLNKFSTSHFTYEFNNVVYLEDDTLYNFNANIGDKWLRKKSTFMFTPASLCDGPRRAVEVVDTGSAIINGLNLKRLTLKYTLKKVENSTSSPISTYTDVVYQKIGSVGKAFSPESCEFMNSEIAVEGTYSIGFRCYSDNAFSNYSPSTYTNSCTYINTTNIYEYSNYDKLMIHPNPCKEEVTLNFNFSKNGLNYNSSKICIINSLGQLLLSREIKNDESLTIKVGSYPKGIYFLKLIDEDSKTHTQKLIVE